MNDSKKEYICDDRHVESCPEVDSMTDYEAELEFQKRFAEIGEQSL